MCSTCDEEIRSRQAVRVEGPWRQFWTLGVPAGAYSLRASWERIHGWVAKLLRRLRKEASKTKEILDFLPAIEKSRRRLYVEQIRVRTLVDGEVEYAWALEPHRSGWPHLHMVSTVTWAPFAWVRKIWGRIIGAECKWSKVKEVKDVDGVCKYLAKYISKTTFPPDLVAMMYRRRLWACSLQAKELEPTGWEPEPATTAMDAWLQATCGVAGDEDEGWTPTIGRSGEYQMWSRYSRWEAIATKDGPVSRLVPVAFEAGASLERMAKLAEGAASRKGRVYATG